MQHEIEGSLFAVFGEFLASHEILLQEGSVGGEEDLLTFDITETKFYFVVNAPPLVAVAGFTPP